MPQPPLHLGALPPEVFDKLFSELDAIHSLASFILTARFVYHRFRPRRETILFRVLQNELGPALPDARFLFVFPYADPADDEHYYDWLYVMAAVYRDMLPRPKGLGVLRDPEGGGALLDRLTALCRTLHHINFLADTYTTMLLTSFSAAGGDGTAATAPLSRAERRRVVRAFYRWQVVSNAWASTRRPAYWEIHDSNVFSSTSSTGAQRTGLLAVFDPWEMQQIDHANYFVLQLCRALVFRAEEAGEAGQGIREISPRQFADLHAHDDHLVRYLRAHPALTKAALADPQPGQTPQQDERVRKECRLGGGMRCGGTMSSGMTAGWRIYPGWSRSGTTGMITGTMAV
ncbi:hypothetical protein C8A05DRAFT_47461 [Staphylotrichum tortipilum]|uniref:Uncharacterized protein n=1 Tax=Staphylotrichum tortipilum TaxID=2831512 RepID=A0AAN6MC98_9PEZI|nr:hypothetical protein C8A05DRAFT_47461 [Staphylotrichum longicolle]